MPHCDTYIYHTSCGTCRDGKNNYGNNGQKSRVRYYFNETSIIWNYGHGVLNNYGFSIIIISEYQ